MATTPPKKSIWEQITPPITAASLLITPLIVAFMAYEASDTSTSKDYVALSISILNSKDSPPASRKWAASLLSKLSPVTVPSELQQGLEGGAALTGGATIKTVEVKVPIAISCIDRKMFKKVSAYRPKDLTAKSLPADPDERQRAIINQVIKLENYADQANILLDACSKLPKP